MKSFILLILFSIPSFATELCEVPGGAFEMPADLVHAMDAVALLHQSVSPTEYANAFCKTVEVPEYNLWLENKGNVSPSNRVVKGFNFQNQPSELMDAFNDIVKNMPARSSSCSTVLCAVDEIWGPQIGRQILYIRARHGYNTSELAFENTRKFRSSELDDIIISMGDLPPEMEMIGHGKNQRMTLEAEGVVSKDGADVLADSSIKFFDRWRSSASTFTRRYSLFHEFGHNIAYQKGRLDNSTDWRSIPRCQVSKYGNTDHFEDFAESFTMYRFNGPGLQQRCPAKYDYLRDHVFKKDERSRPREYLDNSQCY